ncbi:hypothetical protein SLEP1_g48514 [Rubroshorea leprosula]|uniref:AMP-activated protein kinase glycogen-binding domain-containing protein n=1 Tax=Rubroshorea leprosula TaxID=152421 RepID=A0AAV5LUQ5_9ROSI|nr:hypothetical protein SLEP1_g48514 [Rubroshorea leprosula]
MTFLGLLSPSFENFKLQIKFIVDGQWTIDPQKESVYNGGICNNILLVDR